MYHFSLKPAEKKTWYDQQRWLKSQIDWRKNCACNNAIFSDDF